MGFCRRVVGGVKDVEGFGSGRDGGRGGDCSEEAEFIR